MAALANSNGTKMQFLYSFIESMENKTTLNQIVYNIVFVPHIPSHLSLSLFATLCTRNLIQFLILAQFVVHRMQANEQEYERVRKKEGNTVQTYGEIICAFDKYIIMVEKHAHTHTQIFVIVRVQSVFMCAKMRKWNCTNLLSFIVCVCVCDFYFCLTRLRVSSGGGNQLLCMYHQLVFNIQAR